MAEHRQVTRKDVAVLAGVSGPTVSLVLNGVEGVRVREETRKRIFAAAERLGYRPNASARSLVTGTTGAVGVVLYHVGTPFSLYPAGILSGFWNVLCDRSLRMFIENGQSGATAVRLFAERSVDGMLLLAPPFSAGEEARRLCKSGFPLVLVGDRFDSLETDYADIDNYESGRQAMKVLLDAGHTRILHISGQQGLSSARERLKAYRDALREEGLRCDKKLVYEGFFGAAAEGVKAVESALGDGVDFTAVFASSDSLAFGAVEALARRGVNVPDDVSVIGIDGMLSYPLEGQRLTTIRQPLEQIGRTAAGMLLERIDGYVGPPRMRLLKGEMLTGTTVRPPRHAKE